jgi:hypothetical protein
VLENLLVPYGTLPSINLEGLPDRSAPRRGASGRMANATRSHFVPGEDVFGPDRNLTLAKPPQPPRLATVADLRQAVEDALEQGAAASDLILRLTLRDSARIKRSPLFAESEIRFQDGEMLVMGVRTAIGQIANSVLERAPIPSVE